DYIEDHIEDHDSEMTTEGADAMRLVSVEAVGDAEEDRTMTAPLMTTETAHSIEEAPVENLTSLREEQESADALPSTPARERIMLDTRNEAAGALEKLADVPGFIDPAHIAKD